jgi:hypothetical protein
MPQGLAPVLPPEQGRQHLQKLRQSGFSDRGDSGSGAVQMVLTDFLARVIR